MTESLEVVILNQRGMLSKNCEKDHIFKEYKDNSQDKFIYTSKNKKKEEEYNPVIALVGIGPREYVYTNIKNKEQHIYRPNANETKFSLEIPSYNMQSLLNLQTFHGNKGSKQVHITAESLSFDSTSTKTVRAFTIILRDVPEDTTEDDIRCIFASGDNPEISELRREIGKCWFVTFDPSASQKKIMATMFYLRTKSIKNEPIKARLKVQSIIPSSGQTYHYGTRDDIFPNSMNISISNDSIGKSHPLYKPYSKNTGNRKEGTSSLFTTNRSNFIFDNNSGHYRYINSIREKIYSGDSFCYSSATFKKLLFTGGSGRVFRGGINKRHGKNKHIFPTTRKKNVSTQNTTSKSKIKEQNTKLSIPPPLVDEHFPTLGSFVTKKATSIKSMNMNDSNDAALAIVRVKSNDAVESADTNSKQIKCNVAALSKYRNNCLFTTNSSLPIVVEVGDPKNSSPAKTNIRIPTRAYAAALLKYSPKNNCSNKTNDCVAPTISNSSLTRSRKLSSNAILKEGVCKNVFENIFISTKCSSSVSTKEESISDAKSSVSSKMESEKFVNSHITCTGCTDLSPSSLEESSGPTNVVLWVGGRSFADIVKN